jgi:hypothetical protein
MDAMVSPLLEKPVQEPGPGTPGRRSSRPEWLLRATIESVLIVSSILLALAVDEWRTARQEREVAEQSLQIFEREMRQNMERLDGVTPFHAGLRDVVAGMAKQPERIVEVQSIMEGLEAPVLLNTAWETAVATGALTHIPVETVSALSLTYSMQRRYTEDTRNNLPRLVMVAETTESQKLRFMQEAMTYLNALVRSEQDLHGVYEQALLIVSSSPGRPRRDEAGVVPPDG